MLFTDPPQARLFPPLPYVHNTYGRHPVLTEPLMLTYEPFFQFIYTPLHEGGGQTFSERLSYYTNQCLRISTKPW